MGVHVNEEYNFYFEDEHHFEYKLEPPGLHEIELVRPSWCTDWASSRSMT